ncbi:MAG TPA: hypothetical protein PKD56_14930, partial [Chitinophagales bacterium]|nr:hypothetical protein [Chitinophagales bacterium]
GTQNPKRLHLLTQKALHLIQQFRMSDVNTVLLQQKINHAITENPAFNLYAFLSKNGYMK